MEIKLDSNTIIIVQKTNSWFSLLATDTFAIFSPDRLQTLKPQLEANLLRVCLCLEHLHINQKTKLKTDAQEMRLD